MYFNLSERNKEDLRLLINQKKADQEKQNSPQYHAQSVLNNLKKDIVKYYCLNCKCANIIIFKLCFRSTCNNSLRLFYLSYFG